MIGKRGASRDVPSCRHGYDEFEKGFEAMRSGESGKVILDWSQP